MGGYGVLRMERVLFATSGWLGCSHCMWVLRYTVDATYGYGGRPHGDVGERRFRKRDIKYSGRCCYCHSSYVNVSGHTFTVDSVVTATPGKCLPL